MKGWCVIISMGNFHKGAHCVHQGTSGDSLDENAPVRYAFSRAKTGSCRSSRRSSSPFPSAKHEAVSDVAVWQQAQKPPGS